MDINPGRKLICIDSGTTCSISNNKADLSTLTPLLTPPDMVFPAASMLLVRELFIGPLLMIIEMKQIFILDIASMFHLHPWVY
jgi:hypothetical protein